MQRPTAHKRIATHLVLLLVVVVVGATSSKEPKFRRFKSDRDDIWQDCFFKYRRID